MIYWPVQSCPKIVSFDWQLSSTALAKAFSIVYYLSISAFVGEAECISAAVFRSSWMFRIMSRLDVKKQHLKSEINFVPDLEKDSCSWQLEHKGVDAERDDDSDIL